MRHRHLEPVQEGTLSAVHIDDIMERGLLDDWVELGRALRDDPEVRKLIKEVAERSERVSERSDRPRFWSMFCRHMDERAGGFDR